MPVRDNQMVDRFEPNLGGHAVDAFGIAAAGVAAVDKHRFARRRSDQRRGSPFGVDEKDVETGILISGSAANRRKCQRQACDGQRTAKHKEISIVQKT
jgi:hypothetical protein